MVDREPSGLLFGGDWTEQKLRVLSQYLSSYNRVLKNQPFTRIYVDAFAGTGYREKRRREWGLFNIFEESQEAESQRFLKGSAKRALEVQPRFHRYICVESDPENVRSLEAIKREHCDLAGNIEVVQGDANEFVQTYCRTETWRSTRAVLFLDPFATQVEWSTIEAIAKTNAIDVWILFPVMAVNRLLANDPHKACRARLDAIFGTEDWFERFYRTRQENSIFGKPLETVGRACDFDAIGEFYLERLVRIFAGVCRRPGVLRNSRGSPLFQLFFAAGNERGAEIAVRIADHLLRSI